MAEDIRSKYDARRLLEEIPTDRGELFLGYRATIDSAKWRERFRQDLLERSGRPVLRSIWEHIEDPDRSVVVDVTECASAADAVDELMQQLADNQLAELELKENAYGPAFTHPEGLPAALYFRHANLVVTIVGQGENGGNVDIWGDATVQVLDGRSELRHEDAWPIIKIEPGVALHSSGELISLPKRFLIGKDAWLKIEVEGAVPSRGKEPGQVLIGPASGRVAVRVWAFKPGRETLRGRLEYGD